MLSDDGDDFQQNHHHNHHHHHLNLIGRVSTTSSSSTISSNHSPPPPPSLTTTTKRRRRTMEEVWKDINLSTTNHPVAGTGKSYRGFMFQDFLAKPFSPTTRISSSSSSPAAAGYGSPSPPPPPPPPPPPVTHPPPSMLLNLNSGPADQMNFLAEEDPTRNVCPFDQVLASANSSSGLLSNGIGGMWMLPATDRTGGDRRHKRMIKNRESAARSRARKQAYTNELENEVERLKEENARLKRQQQQIQVATAAQVSKKGALQRTSTAPF